MLKQLLRGVGAATLAGAGLAAGAYWYLVKRPLPNYRLQAALAGLDAAADVLWDQWGVPHVYAQTEDDAWFVLGYLHAQDRLWQMEFQRRIASGRLSELFGKRTLEQDRMLRRIGFRRVAEAESRVLDDATAAMITAYCAGVNAFLRQNRDRLPVEFTLLRYQPEPWSPVDTLAWGKLMGWSLAVNWDFEVFRQRMAALVGPEVARYLEQPYAAVHPTTVEPGGSFETPEEATLRLGALGGGASNAWVASGARTATGSPLLASDPHLIPQVPSPWYEVHLECPVFRSAGVSLPGAPGLWLGHNEHIAWGMTAGLADIQDAYAEEIDRESGRYRRGDGWVDAQTVDEPIGVRGQLSDEVERVFVTSHGPVLAWEDEGRRGFAVRSSLLEPVGAASATGLVRASNWAEFRAALATWPWASLNFVYADTQGNIGYQLAGLTPRRRDHDGATVAQGGDPRAEWDGYLTIDELPHAFNPPEGYLVTSNNRPAGDGWPTPVPGEWADGFRAQRIEHVLRDTERLTSDHMAALQNDTQSLAAAELLALVAKVPVYGDRAHRALGMLTAWNGDVAAESRGAALYEVFRLELLRGLLHPLLGANLDAYFGLPVHAFGASTPYTLRVSSGLLRLLRDAQAGVVVDGRRLPDPSLVVSAALEAATTKLEERLGPDETAWSWGALHQLTLAHPLAQIPPLKWLFNLGPFPLKGDGDTVHQAAYRLRGVFEAGSWTPSYRFVADLSDWDKCRSVHLPGQSGQPGSRHYADQLPLWRTGRLHPMPFSRGAVEAATVSFQAFTPPSV